MNKTAIQTKTRAGALDQARLTQEVSKVGLSAAGIGAGLISLWAMACIVGGLVSAGGPVAFVASWFDAITKAY